jgi:hypothetical protein
LKHGRGHVTDQRQPDRASCDDCADGHARSVQKTARK